MILKKVVKVEKKEPIFIKNKLKENNKKTKREIATSEIIKKIPNWENLFFIVNVYNFFFL